MKKIIFILIILNLIFAFTKPSDWKNISSSSTDNRAISRGSLLGVYDWK